MMRIHNRLVAGAAAGIVVLGEPGAHFFAGRVGVLVQQRLGRDDHAGRAETALGRAVNGERHLDRVQLFGRADALDGDDRRAIRHAAHLGHAGQGEFAIHDDRAGAAVPIVARDFRAGQEQLLAQDIRQGGFGIMITVLLTPLMTSDFFSIVPPIFLYYSGC